MKLKLEVQEEKIRTTVKLKNSSIETLSDYKKYQSSKLKSHISSDTIIDALIETLYRDKDFVVFKKEHTHFAPESIQNERRGRKKK